MRVFLIVVAHTAGDKARPKAARPHTGFPGEGRAVGRGESACCNRPRSLWLLHGSEHPCKQRTYLASPGTRPSKHPSPSILSRVSLATNLGRSAYRWSHVLLGLPGSSSDFRLSVSRRSCGGDAVEAWAPRAGLFRPRPPVRDASSAS